MYALESGCYDDIMSWSPSGLAFVIMNPSSFEKKVLPDLFKEAKFSSFDRKVRAILSTIGSFHCITTRLTYEHPTNKLRVRQIKRWGFVKAKVNRGTKSCCYGHPNFQRGNYSLCMKISCSEKQLNHVFGFLQGPTSSVPTSTSLGSTSSLSLSPFITNGADYTFGAGEPEPSLLPPSAYALDNNGTSLLRADDLTHIARLVANRHRHKVQHRSRNELGFMSDGISAISYPRSSALSSSTGSRSSMYEESNDRSHAEGLFRQYSHINEYPTMPSPERQMAFEIARMKDQQKKRTIASSLAYSNVSDDFSEDRRMPLEITGNLQGDNSVRQRRIQDSSIQFQHSLPSTSTRSSNIGTQLHETDTDVKVKELEEVRKKMIIRNALTVLRHDL